MSPATIDMVMNPASNAPANPMPRSRPPIRAFPISSLHWLSRAKSSTEKIIRPEGAGITKTGTSYGRPFLKLSLQDSARSDDLAVLVAPIAVANEALVELARRMTRQLFLKVDGARAFDRRKLVLAELQQLR